MRFLSQLNFFRHWSITQKLILTVLTMLLGFGGIAWAYTTLVTVQSAADQRTKVETDYLLAFDRTRAALLAAQSDARQFLTDHTEATLTGFAESIAEAKDQAAALEEVEQDDRQRVLTAELITRIDAFELAVAEAEKQQRVLGMDENSGLHGRMRQAVHNLEGLVAGDRELEYWMLMMRRHEKNFIQRGTAKYIDRMDAATAGLMNAMYERQGTPSAEVIAQVNHYVETFAQFVDAFKLRGQAAAVFDEEEALLAPLIASAVEPETRTLRRTNSSETPSFSRVNRVFIGVLAVIGILVTLSLGLLALGMTRSLGRLRTTVQQVTEGDLQARCALTGSDELAQLGNAFDTMLDERVSTLAEVEKERDTLNDSIIALMGAVAQLSQKDLTVKAVVAEDVTGPVADAVNLMTSETTNVLSKIQQVAQQVEQAANRVKAQAEKVTEVAGQERRLVQESAEELQQAGLTMAHLAKGAKGANDIAGVAMDHTRNALAAVSTTVGGIEQIREIIRETEKRIKRLGERSQEITGAVNLINTIAERTHILALNASMHAASAGEAGRGFAVVADEVQRLAESSREATSDISSMVNAIRVETADTVDTMNRVIAQVAEGTRLAQQAGQKMEETETATAELVSAVRGIAEGAEKQARSALAMMKRSQLIVKSTEQTGEELKEQSAHTVNLVDYSNTLRESVSVFKLPAAAA